jgi:hypothetical protein
MIPSRQAPREQRSIELKHRSRRAFRLETSMRHRLMKQQARLLRMREDLAKQIQRLRGEACEETPNNAATDSFDRDLVLGLVSFEQEGAL